MSIALLLGIVSFEGLLLFWGQRRIVPLLLVRSRLLAYLLSFPGTVLHEMSHLLMALALRVPTGRVELFRPRQNEDGSLQLGMVETAETSTVQQALIASAPMLLVPALLGGILSLLLGTEVWSQPLSAFLGAPLWAQIVTAYLLLSSAGAAFPSVGDHIPVVGALIVVGFFSLLLFLLQPDFAALLQMLALGLAPAALAAALQLLLLRAK